MVNGKAGQGDIIKLDLNPVKGHEQAGYRPALVVSHPSLRKASSMTLLCPITNTDRSNPVHVRLEGLLTTGVVMCDQIRAVDLRARDYKIMETVCAQTLWEVCDIIQGAVEAELAEP